MPDVQDGHTHNSAANAAELLLYVWPFWDNGHERVKKYTFEHP